MKAKKLVAVGMTVLMLGGLFVGCGNSADTSTGANSGKNVKITIFQSKIEANEGYKKLIAAYEKDHPNVEINLEAVTGNDFGASMKAKMQSDPPTIFSVGGFSDMKDYGDVIEDVSDLDIMQHALEGTTDTFTKDGKVYAIPLYMEGYGFVINKQMFEDAGVSVDSMMNFEGMKAGFDTLKEKIDNGEMKDKYPNLEAVMEYPTKELWIAGDHDANVALTHDFKTPNEAYAADSLPGTGFEDYKKMVDFQASYTTNANNTANLNSVDYTTSLEGGLAIERVACIKQGNWVAPAVETTDPAVLQKLDMLPYSVPGYSDGKYFVGVSGYYGPFRDAAHSAPGFGDRKTYQMDPANGKEALREVEEDILEGADMIIAKPALGYMDVMKEIALNFNIPIVAYNVSGEYAMVKAAAMNGWIDEKKIVMENMTGFKRAGAKMIITYHAIDVAKWLKEE